MDYSYFTGLNKDITNMQFDYKKTVGDKIEGEIEVGEDSYLVSSIPFDKGYTIYIDNKKSKLLKVNKAFIGTNITKGRHKVKIVYQAPFLLLGKVVSIVSLIILFVIIFIEKCQKKRKTFK